MMREDEEFSTTLGKVLSEDLRRKDPLRRLMTGSKKKFSRVKLGFHQTAQNFALNKNNSSVDKLHRPAHTSQAQRMVVTAKDPNSRKGAGVRYNPPQRTHQSADSDYIHMDHLAYRNYKYHKINEKSFITDVPFRKPPVYIFKNNKETIEKAIQNLHLKKLYLREESPEYTNEKALGRRTGSIHDLEKTLETAKQQQLEDYSRQKAERKKKELENQSVQLDHAKKVAQGSKTHSNNFYTLSTPVLHQRPITSGKDDARSLKSFDSYRKTQIKGFGGTLAGDNLKVKSSALKTKLLREEFDYYSKLTKQFLEEVNDNLQDQKLEAYSYEEYKLLKHKFSMPISLL